MGQLSGGVCSATRVWLWGYIYVFLVNVFLLWVKGRVAEPAGTSRRSPMRPRIHTSGEWLAVQVSVSVNLTVLSAMPFVLSKVNVYWLSAGEIVKL